MRVSENRYRQDLRRLNLAQQLIEHGVRTHWICAITGMTPNRVRNLLRSYGKSAATRRQRGLAPTSCDVFFRQGRRRESAVLAGLAKLFGLVPKIPVSNARKVLPGIEWGERLCRVFDLFGSVVGEPAASMDQFLLLVTALAEGRLRVGFCARCQATILVDPLLARAPLCEGCRAHRHSTHGSRRPAPQAPHAREELGGADTPVSGQQTLF